jgi:hypothetical protein
MKQRKNIYTGLGAIAAVAAGLVLYKKMQDKNAMLENNNNSRTFGDDNDFWGSPKSRYAVNLPKKQVAIIDQRYQHWGEPQTDRPLYQMIQLALVDTSNIYNFLKHGNSGGPITEEEYDLYRNLGFGFENGNFIESVYPINAWRRDKAQSFEKIEKQFDKRAEELQYIVERETKKYEQENSYALKNMRSDDRIWNVGVMITIMRYSTPLHYKVVKIGRFAKKDAIEILRRVGESINNLDNNNLY